MTEVPVKSVVIDGVKYISVRRPLAQETDISCRRCALHNMKVGGVKLCVSPEHHDICDFCTDMLRQGWHVWFIPAY